MTLTNTELLNNGARLCGGGLANDGTTVTSTGGGMQSNAAGLSGGGLHNAANMTVTKSYLGYNAGGDDGGAASNRGNGNLSMVQCSITGNTARGIHVTGYNLYLSDGVGGAISSAKALTLTGCSLYNNTATGYGGGLFVTGTTQAVDCTIWQNAATDGGGGGMTNVGTATLTFEPMGQPLETQVCVFVDSTKRSQTILGIGGALTDAAAETFARLPAQQH